MTRVSGAHGNRRPSSGTSAGDAFIMLMNRKLVLLVQT